MKKEFNLLKSEIRKAEALANKTLGTNDCKVTGWYTRPTEQMIKGAEWRYVKCEICHNYEERADIDIYLSIPMFDRRMTRATLTQLI